MANKKELCESCGLFEVYRETDDMVSLCLPCYEHAAEETRLAEQEQPRERT